MRTLWIVLIAACTRENELDKEMGDEVFCVETEEGETYCCPEFAEEEDCFYLEE